MDTGDEAILDNDEPKTLTIGPAAVDGPAVASSPGTAPPRKSVACSAQLDPFYIEVCRRVRLCPGRGQDGQHIFSSHQVPKLHRIAVNKGTERADQGTRGLPPTKSGRVCLLPCWSLAASTYRRISDYLNPEDCRDWPELAVASIRKAEQDSVSNCFTGSKKLVSPKHMVRRPR